MSETASEQPHRRRNPLTGGHVLVSPQRGRRPWLGAVEDAADARGPARDPGCALCPGGRRSNGEVNPDYAGAFVFANDFPAVEAEAADVRGDGLFEASGVRGAARVICFSPDHGASLPLLPVRALRGVVDVWCEQAEELGRDHASVQVFENKGAMMGCSNPHPHGQVWATDVLPDEVAREDAHQRDWLARRGATLLAEVAAAEAGGPREVVACARWLAIVPWWAAWPFETLLLPRFDVARLPELGAADRDALAAILKRLTTRYDNLFRCAFPYSMGWHGAPFGADAAGWRLHAHFYPPLLRSKSVRKFMVGYEMLAEPQRDLTPEAAAERLRALSDTHYLEA